MAGGSSLSVSPPQRNVSVLAALALDTAGAAVGAAAGAAVGAAAAGAVVGGAAAGALVGAAAGGAAGAVEHAASKPPPAVRTIKRRKPRRVSGDAEADDAMLTHSLLCSWK